MQRLAGYALVGTASEECLDYFHGQGGGGKGTFIIALQSALGEYATTATIETFLESGRYERHPTDLAKLAGKRLVVSQEPDEGKRWDEARIKSATGRDVVSARFMRKDFFDYQPIYTLIIAGNHRPGLKTVDAAIRRRFHLVPFTAKIPEEERDTKLKENLALHHLDGILAWALEGCAAWQRDGLRPPACVQAATEDYLAEEDTFAMWLTECCVTDAEYDETSGLAYKSFSDWKRERGEGVPPHKKFTSLLRDRGFPSGRDSSRRFIKGFRLNDIERARMQWADDERASRYAAQYRRATGREE